MNIQFSRDASTQPLLAVLVNADNMMDVLSEPDFAKELTQLVMMLISQGKMAVVSPCPTQHWSTQVQ